MSIHENVKRSELYRLTYPANASSISRRKAVFGVGINDAVYITQPTIDGRQAICPAYKSWRDMLERAYDKEYQSKQPTYIGATVAEEWHQFTEFRSWWLLHHIDGWHLDKDLINPGEKRYSQSSCIYVPRWLNNFTTFRGLDRGECPIGVSFHKNSGKYMAGCSNTITGKNRNVGYFDTPHEAHLAWRSAKMELAYQLKDLMDAIDPRVYFRVTEIIMRAK